MSTNILFTSVGRRVELLKAFRSAYRALQLDGRIVAVDSDPLAPALNFCDRPYVVPRFSSPDYIPSLLEICRREGVSAIFPLIDPDIPVLSQYRELIEETGARLAVVGRAAAEICRDKALQVEFFDGLCLPTPKTWLAGELDPATANYPLFIKPRTGSAGINAFKVNTPQELVFFSNYVPCALVQEFLPGHEVTTDVVCDLDGDVLGVVSRRRIEVRWGEVAKGVTVLYPEITEACIGIARALPAVGPLTVQCMVQDGVPKFTEINARLGGGLPLGIAAGCDSPRWLLARIAGLDIEIPEIGCYRTGCYLTRFDDSVILSELDYEEMAGRRI